MTLYANQPTAVDILSLSETGSSETRQLFTFIDEDRMRFIYSGSRSVKSIGVPFIVYGEDSSKVTPAIKKFSCQAIVRKIRIGLPLVTEDSDEVDSI